MASPTAGETGHLADHGEHPVHVDHGATAGTTRPTLGSGGNAATVCFWDGSVEPDNGVTGDYWYDDANDVWKRYDGSSWVSSGASTSEQFVRITASELQSHSGSPTRGIANNFDSWSMGAASHLMRGHRMVPEWWNTFAVDLEVVDTSTDAGTWRYRALIRGLSDGESSVTTVLDYTGSAEASPAQDDLTVVEVATGLSVVAGRRLAIFAGRTSGGTHAANMDLVAVVLRRES